MQQGSNFAAGPLENISGSIERVTFYSPDTGFCVLRVKVKGHRELVTIVGNSLSVNAGEYVGCSGVWFNDKSHGLQFKANKLDIIEPTTIEGIEKYLGSGLVKGIGPGFAKRLVSAFGTEVFEIIEHHPEKLTQLNGIGVKRKEQILSAWVEQKRIREIVVFLHSHNIGTARAVRIYKTYGDLAIAKVRENPYRLALDIIGIGFKTADLLAMSLGIGKDSMIRARAGVLHVLQEYNAQGHCAAMSNALVDSAHKILDIESSIIESAIKHEIAAGTLIVEDFAGHPGLFLSGFYNAELSVATRIRKLQAKPIPWGKIDLEKAIPWVEKKNNIELSKTQKDAIKLAVSNKVIVITGGPGVGKTTVVNSILSILKVKTTKILLCAPTGRAAKRLAESTGMEAKTLHRMLAVDAKNYGFKHNQDNPLDAELLVIDETSMVDVLMMNHLLKAIPPGCVVIFVGDVDQLPSIGPGSVLANFIDSKVIPTIKLTEIFRQAANSQIIINAHRINKGYMPNYEVNNDILNDFYFVNCDTPEVIQKKLIHVVSKRIPQRFKLDPKRDIQVLTPMNRGGLGARALNIELKKYLNKGSGEEISRYGTSYAVGDKIIQTVNNYDKDVFNGDIGYIRQLVSDESKFIIEFDAREVEYHFNELDEISLAYAITIHKSQGSEYPAIVIPIAMQHYKLLEKNLIYTGVTRGKKLVVIVGQIKALGIAVKNKEASGRITKLTERLQQF